MGVYSGGHARQARSYSAGTVRPSWDMHKNLRLKCTDNNRHTVLFPCRRSQGNSVTTGLERRKQDRSRCSNRRSRADIL
jgi:hypothetical protein